MVGVDVSSPLAPTRFGRAEQGSGSNAWFYYFFCSFQRQSGASRGHAENHADHPAVRLRNLLLSGLAQTKILRDPAAGILHALVFWGFLVLGAGTAEIVLHGITGSFTYAALLPAPLYRVYLFSQEMFALLVLAAVSALLYRRIVVKPKRLQGDRTHSTDAIIILGIIAFLMVTLFVIGGFEGVQAPAAVGLFRPVSWAFTGFLNALRVSPTFAASGEAVTFWAHALVILYFLNHLPYSKHLHVIVSLPNTYLSNTSGPGTKGVMKAMDLDAEDAEQFGAADVKDLSWKSLLDGYACTECGRCTAACPANITGKPLSPRKIMINTRQRLMEYAPLIVSDPDAEHHLLLAGEGADAGSPTMVAAIDNRLLDNYITEDELWACTSCRACVEECPVSIDQLSIINELRRNLVLMESRFPDEIQPAFQSLERNGTPWAFSPADHELWTEGLEIQTMAELMARGERPDILFWVGCMGSFDDRSKKITVAFARILKAAKVNFAILGQEESCNGDPARRMGNEYLYQMLAKQAIQTLDRYEVKTIVTFCPHCFHQI